ncbi:MAG: DUF1080 domain-containing protein [Isosphaeraceae bacterium]
MRPSIVTALFACVWVSLAAECRADSPKIETGLGARPPEGAVALFDGSGLEGWVKADGKTPAAWAVEDGIFTVVRGQGSIQSKAKFGDAHYHVEFNVPYMPDAKGQARGNSGAYVAGAYEVQILDSYGLKSKDNDCAAVYKQVAPSVNACKPPLQWQSFDITFHKAVVEGGKVVKKARITVVHNGVTVIDDAEISVSPGGVGTSEGEDGPLMLQDHGDPVQFRNVWVKPL